MDLGYRLSVGERDAGQQSQGQLGDVEVGGGEDVHSEAGTVVLYQGVHQRQAGQLQRSLVLFFLRKEEKTC